MHGRKHTWVEAIAEPTRLHIVRSLAAVSKATAADLAGGAASAQTLRRHLEALVATGLVDELPGESDGETPGRPAAHFRLVPEIRESVTALFAASPRPVAVPAGLR